MVGWLGANELLFQTMLIYAILAFSVQVSLRAGVFSLAGVGCWAMGAYTLGILNRYGVSSAAAIVVAIAIAGIASYLLALILVRLRGLYLAMATIAFNQMVAIALLNGGDFTGGEAGLYGINTKISTIQVIAVVAVLALLLTGLERGAIGRALDTVRDDDELATSLALDSARLRRFAFVLSGMIGALGGALNAMLLGIANPSDTDFSMIVVALTMVIVGGFHSWRGALLGAILIQWLPVGLQSFGVAGMSAWWSTVYGALIVLISVFVPRGLLGVCQILWRELRNRNWSKTSRLTPLSAVDDQSQALGARDARRVL